MIRREKHSSRPRCVITWTIKSILILIFMKLWFDIYINLIIKSTQILRAPLQKSVKEFQKVSGTHKIFFEISSVKRSFVGKKKTSGLAAMVSQDVSHFDPYSWSLALAFLVDTVIRKINRWKVKDWPCEVSIFQTPLKLFKNIFSVFSLSSLLMCSHDARARAQMYIVLFWVDVLGRLAAISNSCLRVIVFNLWINRSGDTAMRLQT